MKLLGIDPATFRIVAQCLKHCATVCSKTNSYRIYKKELLNTDISKNRSVNGKGKVNPVTYHEGREGCKGIQLYSFFNLGAR
jgi:hypothetical protein